MHALLAIALALAPAPTTALVAAPASESLPEDPAARAGVLFEAGRFAEAADAFGDAYEATGDAAFLFGRAQALRRAGNCGATIEVLEQFIGTHPPASDVAEAERVIGECRTVLGDSEPDPVPEVEPLSDPVQPEPGPDPEPKPEPKRDRSAWSRDVTGGVLLGTGVFATVAGVGAYAGGVAMARERDEAESGFESRQRRVRATSGAGIALMAVGGALMVGAVVRYVLVSRRSPSRPVARHPLRWRF